MSKGWTEERRQKARERILKNKPWEKSTGPKTPAGKQNVALNALKHGGRSRVALALAKQILGLNKISMEQIDHLNMLDQTYLIHTNKLIEKCNKNSGKANEAHK